MTPPVLFGILRGTRSGEGFERFRRCLSSLHPFPVTAGDGLKAAQWAQRLRGRRVKAKTLDFLIAYQALRRRLVLLHADRDFDRIAAVVPLKVESCVKFVPRR